MVIKRVWEKEWPLCTVLWRAAETDSKLGYFKSNFEKKLLFYVFMNFTLDKDHFLTP
jgi:hypothetical protein